MLAVLLLGGCTSLPPSINPVEWWHGLQGGKIAEQRPPPPGATDPDPNLATVPPKPDPSNPDMRARIADALIADRANAQYAASQAPLPDPSSPSASPRLFGAGTAPPPRLSPAGGSGGDDQQPSASLNPAPSPPPPPPGPTASAASGAVPAPSRAPVGKVDSVPLAPPSTEVPDPGALPPVPTNPPSPPDLPGVAQATAPTPPAPTPPPVPGPLPVPTVPPLAVAFVPGSAQLPPDQQDALKAFAATRGKFNVAVTGFGEATTSDPAAQEAALVLGQARAQAIATALMANGVPGNAVRTDALATGHGGVARLVN